jgi:hypothetical protein
MRGCLQVCARGGTGILMVCWLSMSSIDRIGPLASAETMSRIVSCDIYWDKENEFLV